MGGKVLFERDDKRMARLNVKTLVREIRPSIRLVFGVGIIVGAGMALYYGGFSRVSAIGLGAYGCYLCYRGVKGLDPRDEPREPSRSLRFRALANPDYPLADATARREDPVSGRAAAREAGGAGT